MKTFGLLAGFAGALAASVGCGGTVVFEEDGGEGGAGSSQNGPISSSTVTSANGGNGPVSTVGTTVGPSTSTGITGCGSFLESFGAFSGDCIGCMDANCCTQQLQCDVGTECYDCYFGSGNCTDAAIAASEELFSGCYPVCQSICEQQPCGNDFQCFDGTCIPFDWVCDGFPDCFEGEDEFCEDSGICGTGVTVFDQEADACLGEFCCDPFLACSSFGEDPESCQQCLENGGGELCNDAIDCAIGSPCFGEQQSFPICGGLSVGDEDVADCLNRSCCAELENCSGGPDGSDGCAQCFETGGPLCDPVIDCYFTSCDFEGEDGDDDPGG
jgi:hypothetical protein